MNATMNLRQPSAVITLCHIAYETCIIAFKVQFLALIMFNNEQNRNVTITS